MASFTKTIPAGKAKAEVEALLAGCDHFLPLAQIPSRAQAGDFIYIIYRGMILARARIRALEVVKRDVISEERAGVEWARSLVHFTGEWEKPGRAIPAQGHQSVRYLDVQGLAHLDGEKW
jgi:hypothetical protein